MGPSYAKGARGKRLLLSVIPFRFFSSEKRREVAGRKRGFKGKQDKKKLGRLCGLAREKKRGTSFQIPFRQALYQSGGGRGGRRQWPERKSVQSMGFTGKHRPFSRKPKLMLSS